MKSITLILSSVMLLSPMFGQTPCLNGSAGIYSCNKVDLLSYMDRNALSCGSSANDVWGWTDPITGKEYALMGCSVGTSFVDISDPMDPVLVGTLATHTFSSTWRDIKVHADHAFIVSEASGHGMQVFDLSRLDTVTSPPAVFTENAHFGLFGNAHNIAINEQSGYAYVIGSNQCNGGIYIINIQNPTQPVLAGCYDLDGYIHDTQCVDYIGPDPDHQGKRICINSHSGNPDRMTVVDVSDPTDAMHISTENWPNARIGHQGWLTEDHRFYLQGDEGDELNSGYNTRTFVFDVTDLDDPVLVGWYSGTNASTDHNLYTHQGLVFQANYTSGLQILDPVDLNSATMQEVAWFDTYTTNNAAGYNGAWSNYPYFASGNVLISDYGTGLYVVRPHVVLTLNVLLEGPYVEVDQLMHDSLRVKNLIPLTEPYSGLGYTFTGGGGEVTLPGVLAVSGSDAIVDWMVIELRSAMDSSQVVYSRAALLQRDGDVVDVDGTSPVRMDVALNTYFIALRHRNHLSIMTALAMQVSIAERGYALSEGSLPLFGTTPMKTQGAIELMWAGNAIGDVELKYTGNGNDRDPILVQVGGSIPTATLDGYFPTDVNMDGTVKYTGLENDRDPILVNIGGSIPTAIRPEQLP